jgi:uncharacterized Zn-binding protein involved in type VI secretion
MPGIQRKGDPNSAGGIAMQGIDSVRINGRPVVVEGMSVSPHPCCGQKGCPPVHCNAVTKNGNGTVKAGGIPIVVDGSVDTCGHPRVNGSSDVRIG